MATIKKIGMGRRLYNILIEERSFPEYFLFFFILIFCFGFLYSFMPEDHGVVPKESANFWPNVFHGMYFSVVTITSLGYGDIKPEGLSRLFAGIQVVLGLTVIGLMIAKLTSVRVSHFVSSLYASDVQRNLTKFSSNFSTDSENIRSSFAGLADHYQKLQVPSTQVDSTDSVIDKLSDSEFERAKNRFNISVESLRNRSREFHEYLFEATDHGKYLQLINEINLIDLVSAISSALSVINQSIIALYPFQESKSSMAGVPILHLSEIATLHQRSGSLVSENSQHDEINKKCIEIDDLCESISVALRQVPSEEQPDQLYRGDEPVGISETDSSESKGEPR